VTKLVFLLIASHLQLEQNKAPRPDTSAFALKINPNVTRSFESCHWEKDFALNPYPGQYFFTFLWSLLGDLKVLYKYWMALGNLSAEFGKTGFPSFRTLDSEKLSDLPKAVCGGAPGKIYAASRLAFLYCGVY